MFYSQFVLAKKGALGRVWLAAHWDRKLTKAQIYATNVEQSVENIITHEVPFALRMSGHLLLGVTRIYARQVKYLLGDCNEALVKIKMAFRPGETQIDLQPEAAVATFAAITLPETYGEFEITLPDVQAEALSIPSDTLLNVARKRQINLRLRPAGEEEGTQDPTAMDLDDYDPLAGNPMTFDDQMEDTETWRRENESEITGELDFAPQDFGEIPPSPGVSIGTPGTPVGAYPESPAIGTPLAYLGAPSPLGEVGIVGVEPGAVVPAREKKMKRKGVPIDTSTIIDSKVIKKHLQDASDLVREVVPAPPTKRAMLLREREHMDPRELFYRPVGMEGLAREISLLFQRAIDTRLPLQIEVAVGPVQVSPPEIERRAAEEEEITFEGAAPEYDEGITFEPSLSPERRERGEEEEEEEGREAFEGRRGEEEEGEMVTTAENWSERTRKMHFFLDTNFGPNKTEISYLQIVHGQRRRVVAGTFFELLVLKSNNVIDVDQKSPYADISIKKTANFARAS